MLLPESQQFDFLQNSQTIEAYYNIYKYDMIYTSEIYFNFSISADNKRIQLSPSTK